jgi:hypothetical protein
MSDTADRARHLSVADTGTPTEMEERVARAICCPDGICHPRGKTMAGGCAA